MTPLVYVAISALWFTAAVGWEFGSRHIGRLTPLPTFSTETPTTHPNVIQAPPGVVFTIVPVGDPANHAPGVMSKPAPRSGWWDALAIRVTRAIYGDQMSVTPTLAHPTPSSLGGLRGLLGASLSTSLSRTVSNSRSPSSAGPQSASQTPSFSQSPHTATVTVSESYSKSLSRTGTKTVSAFYTPSNSMRLCAISAAGSYGSTVDPTAYGMFFNFSGPNGTTIVPPGTYAVVYSGGCMQYAAGLPWQVHYALGTDNSFWMGSNATDQWMNPPGSTKAENVYAQCEADSYALPATIFNWRGGYLG
jgi:hypothetical protein